MNALLTLPAAVGLGALHALEPGHGKGVISAYLVTTRGGVRDAVLLGVVCTLAHTFSIVALSLTVSLTMRQWASESLTGWIGLLSGLLISWIGGRFLYRQLRPKVVTVGKLSVRDTGHLCDHCHHDHGHHHHVRAENQPNSLWGIVTVGVLTGIIPCPSAIAIFLAAVSADDLPLGLGLVAAFSAGSAAAMSLIGILVIRAQGALKRLEKVRTAQMMALASSLLMLALGVFVTLDSLLQL